MTTIQKTLIFLFFLSINILLVLGAIYAYNNLD